MPEPMLTELEKDERGRVLAAASNSLETSMRNFLVETYLRTIPSHKFGGFWCALGSQKNDVPPIIDRKNMLPFMGENFRRTASSQSNVAKWLRSLPNTAFYAGVLEVCAADPSEVQRRDVLGCLDITGFFKLGFLDSNYEKLMGCTIYGLLAARYPRVAVLSPNKWNMLNSRARNGRNENIGHVNSHTYREMSVAEWRTTMDAWVKIADILHDDDNDALYARVMGDLHTAEKSSASSLYTLQELADASGRFTATETADILQHYRYECVNGAVFCNKDEALHCLSDAARLQELQQTILNMQQDTAQTRRMAPSTSEASVISNALEKRLAKVPTLRLLPEINGEPLTGRALQELAATHYIVLTPSLLKSSEGRSFVTAQLLPAIQQAGRDPKTALIIDSTALYHLFREREAYAKLAAQYRTTVWMPQQEAERTALWQRCQELRYADSAYFFVRDMQLPALGSPDPLSSDEDSLLAVMEAHPFDRFCVLLYGAAGFVRRIDRTRLPFVLVGRVRGGADRPVCTLFPQLLPPVRADKNEPLLASLLAEYRNALGYAKPEKSPAEQPETPPEIVSTMRPENQQTPVPVSIPQTKSVPQHHGTATFAPNLPLRHMDETLLSCSVHPTAGMVLHTEDGDIVTLRGVLMEENEEAKGGEGNLFLTDLPGQVAKLYNAEHLTAGRRDKLDAMLRHDPQIPGLCWPTHMLYTAAGEFLGYTMPQAPDGSLPFSKSVLRIGSPSVHETLLPGWDRFDLVQAARSAAAIVAQLHRRNILMGDVNAGNFMVDPKNSANVFVVDTDSFQLGGFPCPVGVEDFTHPGTAKRLGVTGELKYDTFLRTDDEENYVLAILIFKVLFLNQNPFVTKTKMTYREAMAQKKFPYALTGDNYEVPAGDNWMIWKNLPRKITDAFTEAFTQWKCATAYEWVGLLDYYAASISKYGFSRELAPAKYHEFNPDNPIYVDLVCPCCHREFNIHKNRYAKLHDEYHTPIFCRSCSTSLELHGAEILPGSLVCVKCGKRYDATFRENMIARAEPQRAICPRCRSRRFTKR